MEEDNFVIPACILVIAAFCLINMNVSLSDGVKLNSSFLFLYRIPNQVAKFFIETETHQWHVIFFTSSIPSVNIYAVCFPNLHGMFCHLLWNIYDYVKTYRVNRAQYKSALISHSYPRLLLPYLFDAFCAQMDDKGH